jgi:hypothetical protein
MAASSQSELMLWASGDGEQTFAIAVDPSLERVTFSATFDGTGGSLEVTSPQGGQVQQDERTEDTRLNCGRVVSIEKPPAGTWQLRMAPSGRFWLAARGKSDVSIITAEFVHRAGRPGHEGLFKIQGYPVAGRSATLRVRLSSASKTPAFTLVSQTAQRLQTLTLESVGSNSDNEEFVGNVTLPTEPFRVAASGLDGAGSPWRRVYSALFHAATIEVIPPAFNTLVAGASTPVKFTIRNVGPAARVTLIATDGRGKVLAVEPSTLQLEPATEGAATVNVAVPADARPESEVSILLTTSGADPGAMNYARKSFTVARK